MPTAVMITVDGALANWPSLTTDWKMYWPAISGVNDGVAVVAPLREIELPAGSETIVH